MNILFVSKSIIDKYSDDVEQDIYIFFFVINRSMKFAYYFLFVFRYVDGVILVPGV
jgi:hypothetical protein